MVLYLTHLTILLISLGLDSMHLVITVFVVYLITTLTSAVGRQGLGAIAVLLFTMVCKYIPSLSY